MEKIRRITFGIMLAAVVCAAAACGRNDTNGSTAGQSSGREESSTAPGSRATGKYGILVTYEKEVELSAMYTGRTIRGGMDTEEKKEGKRSGFS